MSTWITPVTDRTQADVNTARELIATRSTSATDLKGCYNPSDMNRVENNVEVLEDRFAWFGIHLTLTTKTDHNYLGLPTVTDRTRYLGNINTLRSALFRYADTPETPTNYNDFTQANDIEKIQADLYEIQGAWRFNYVLDGTWHLGEKPFASYEGTKPIIMTIV